jgi:hypothetical protein
MANGSGTYLLTTEDNPYNPFTEFDKWNAFDTSQGYNTLALLARVTSTSDELSELDNDQAITFAIDEIVNENVSGIHTIVFEPANATVESVLL